MNTHVKTPDCSICELRGKCMFSDLENCYIDEITKHKGFNTYKKGSFIFHENNYPVGIYGIYSGRVKVFKTAESGKEHIIRLAREGEVLGYRSLIAGEKYEVSAMALEDCHVCFISKNLFMETFRQSKNLTGRIMELLASDLKTAEDKIADLAQKTVKERVAETILMLKGYYGLESDQRTIKTALSREDLANLVGTATETLIRSLSEFKKNKVIELKGKKIAILNHKLLERMANNYD
ncbi:MAG: Crp/Fnr family transcriptional regulator [Microscillaceae bacterium]|nr:Crp/Fnr family transcriptional regulator [Microscillaceae bacterium]